jgi:asparagine synthase (glutamine-hydrolysing)
MCGIAGFLSGSNLPGDAANTLQRMTSAIAYRGPDDSGAWLDEQAGVALGHRRLAIIDLSPAGHQPMESASGRYVLTYNGEIYNYEEIRREIEATGAAPDWRGHSDTEVIVAAFDKWGIRSTLDRLNGMFAFAVWDRQTRKLTLARDRLGEKPLYYGRMGDSFLFGSELKALTCHPAFKRDVDREALTLLLRHNYVPAPHSIWRGIQKLLPGHFVEVDEGGRKIGQPEAYWSLNEVARAGISAPLAEGPHLADDLEGLLKDAVGLRMVADVPLGAFLSGGTDSSLVVALMQAQSAKPVRTFTIGFHEEGYNEAVHAKAVARHLGTDHTELYVTPADALALVPRLPAMWDEPFSDSSQIPTFLVSEMTRQHVTVSLSGDAGDELFGGYNRYFLANRIWNATSSLPNGARKLLANLLRAPASAAAADMVTRIMPQRYRFKGLQDRMPKIAQVIEQNSPETLYRALVSHFTDPAQLVLGGSEPETVLTREGPAFQDFREQMMYLDTLTYLPDDILAKVDRASMAVSLESRVPFLDHRVVEYAWRLPMSAKIQGMKGKHILRQILHRHVPEALMERPKMGFGVPLDSWLVGPLRDWAEDLLDERRIRSEGFFDPVKVRQLWEENLSGRRRWHNHLWDLLMFQAWWAEHGASPAVDYQEPPRRMQRAG